MEEGCIRTTGGSGRSIAVNVRNLQETLNVREIDRGSLPSRIAAINLGNGFTASSSENWRILFRPRAKHTRRYQN